VFVSPKFMGQQRQAGVSRRKNLCCHTA
jgi:hypothetical protein